MIHTRPYRETSVLVEALSRHHGRVGLVARSGRKRWRGDLAPFRALLASWSGRGELRTLTQLESTGVTGHLAGRQLVAGLYVNELVLRLTARDDPHERLFDSYHQVLASLMSNRIDEGPLRSFELTLLLELGYHLALDRDANTGEPLDPTGVYRYEIEHGPVRTRPGDDDVYAGGQLLAMAADDWSDAKTRRAARRLTRRVIQYYLGDKPLKTRELWR